eukprot:CAMPEP_0118949452 /NCGR_PEP_ID=MMETSP1169-20130426/49645_1 /TAXON_ID=36882 /ORGANISM="Pyramimonas obovata, Strain CCMP722" /LENGTH=96 /DNA_ID=CAMNT_0006896095 /DNA_START=184 /DNA_END=471 /DNA_ORIENTATION=+
MIREEFHADKENTVNEDRSTVNKGPRGSKESTGKTSKLDWNTRAALLQEQLRAARNAIKAPKDRENSDDASNSSTGSTSGSRTAGVDQAQAQSGLP